MYLYESGFVKAYPVIKSMLQDHWNEIGMSGSRDLEFDLHEDYYKSIDKTGLYAGFMIMVDEPLEVEGIEYSTKCVGYLSFFITPHVHHKTKNFATTDCFYLKPQYRGTREFINLFKEAETILKDRGVTYVHFTFSHGHDLTKLGLAMGYKPCDIVMIKEI